MHAMPRGRPPKDASKLAAYLAAKNAGNMATFEPEKFETDDEILVKIEQRFNIMQEIAKGCAQGAIRAVIVSGAGGTGKTFTVERILAHEKEHNNVVPMVIRGKLTAISLYMKLYEQRHSNCITVLDDADGMLDDIDALSVLKAALDTSVVRTVSWMSQASALKENDVPQSFEFNGSVMFISNIDFNRVIDQGKSKIVDHLKALKTRVLYLDLKLHTPRELVLYITHTVRKNGILIQDGLTKEQQEEALQYLVVNRDKLSSISIRAAMQLSGLMKMKSQIGWSNMADDLMCR